VKKAVMKEKSGKILGLLSGGKKESIFWQKVLQKCTGAKRQKKGGLERSSKKMNAKYFCLRKLFWDTPVYHV
jgi:hypothetical protein